MVGSQQGLQEVTFDQETDFSCISVLMMWCSLIELISSKSVDVLLGISWSGSKGT